MSENYRYKLVTDNFGDLVSNWLSTLLEEAEYRNGNSIIIDNTKDKVIGSYNHKTGWTKRG